MSQHVSPPIDSNALISVLHVIDSLGVGGAERQLSNLVRRSDPLRFRHEVCVLSGGGSFASPLEDDGIRLHNLQKPRESSLAMIPQVLRVVRLVRPDVIHATLFRPSVTSRIVGKLTGSTTITTLVNTTYEPEWRLDNPNLTPAKVGITQLIDRTTARLDTWFVAISESVKTSAVRRLGIPPERITVIHRGLALNTSEIAGDTYEYKKALGWTDAYPLILNVGRLVPQKGQLYAIVAMKELLRRFPTARLVIAGEGWLRPKLEQLIHNEQLESQVTLLGEHHDISRLLSAADIFVFPSLYEGFGNALLEAMAAGKPCVVSRIPALQEVTGQGRGALIVAPQGVHEIAAAISRLAQNRQLAASIGSAAREWVRQRFDFDASVRAHEQLYERLAAGRQLTQVGVPT